MYFLLIDLGLSSSFCSSTIFKEIVSCRLFEIKQYASVWSSMGTFHMSFCHVNLLTWPTLPIRYFLTNIRSFPLRWIVLKTWKITKTSLTKNYCHFLKSYLDMYLTVFLRLLTWDPCECVEHTWSSNENCLPLRLWTSENRSIFILKFLLFKNSSSFKDNVHIQNLCFLCGSLIAEKIFFDC